jgi:hypothetical protein
LFLLERWDSLKRAIEKGFNTTDRLGRCQIGIKCTILQGNFE